MGGRHHRARRTIIEHTYSIEEKKKGFRRTVTINNTTSSSRLL
jgi:hypothetical protein